MSRDGLDGADFGAALSYYTQKNYTKSIETAQRFLI